jgi:hypothetical protein
MGCSAARSPTTRSARGPATADARIALSRGAVKLTSDTTSRPATSATDGRATFDQLYPTGHDKLGLADQVGWRNVHHLREGFEFSPVKATPISVNYHTWWLAEKTDGLYAASGARIASVPGGAASGHVGQEIDVQVTRPLTPQLLLAAGYAHMFTGKFLEQAAWGVPQPARERPTSSWRTSGVAIGDDDKQALNAPGSSGPRRRPAAGVLTAGHAKGAPVASTRPRPETTRCASASSRS